MRSPQTLIETLVTSPAAGAQIHRAWVLAVEGDGAIVAVGPGQVPDNIRCALLQTAKSQDLVLARGDTVLIWRAAPEDREGVVLGRVGPSHAELAPPDAAPEIPNEIVIEAAQNLTFRCGEGSITIRADGKVLIKGKDLVSHAQRNNRIKGGSVAIN